MNTPLPDKAESLRVELGPRSYDIVVGEGLLENAGRLMAPVLERPQTIIITDSNVAPLHLATLEGALDGAGIRHASIVLPAGEQTKDFAHLEDLTARLLEARIERSTTLIALGGGVIGDITGFAAAITLRGLPFIQVPTTLLAQVDSSVGGKTGINSPFGKNLIGAFHQPRLVLADIGVLGTLPRREMLSGCAEVIKYGLIDDPDFFIWLESNGEMLRDCRPDACRHAIMTSCAAKAVIVQTDETERGQRALLNLGHTFGHALEAETGYGDTLLHGEAVAIGMVMAFRLSVRLGLCPKEDLARLETLLTGIGLPHDISGLDRTSWTAAKLLGHMTLDKKVSGGKIVFVLARGIGDTFISDDVDTADAAQILEEAIGA